MVNTIDITQAQYFIPEIWAQTAIPILRNNITVAPRVYRDTDVASFQRGDTLHIPYPGTLAASAKAAGTAYTLAQPSNASEVTVSLDKYYAVSFIIEDIARAEANQDLIANYSEAAIIGLAEQLENDLIETAQGAGTNVGDYGTDLVAEDVREAAKKMTDNKAPQDGRTLVISTKDKLSLLGDSELANYFAFSQSQAVSEGRLGRVYGFDIYESQLITTAGGTPAQTKNIAFRRDGIILAMRGLPDPPPGTGAVASTIRDDVSGLVFRVLMAYDATYGGVRVTFEALYGSKILQDAKTLIVRG